MGTARVKQPWMRNGLPFSRRSIRRSRPASVMFGNHDERSSRTQFWDNMVGLLEGKRDAGSRAGLTLVERYKGQKTPPFAGAKRRGRNREEADIPRQVNLPD